MRSKLRGWGAARAAVVPLMVIGSYFACAWPTWLAYQAGASVPVLWVAGTVTIAACVAQVHSLTGFVAGRPVEQRSAEQLIEDRIPV
jgi:hypothetical protein